MISSTFEYFQPKILKKIEDMRHRFPLRNAGLFGAELYRLRNERGLRQIDIADRAKLSRGYYSQLENSRKGPPSEKVLARIAVALDLPCSKTQQLDDIAEAERCGLGRPTLSIPHEISALIEQLILCGGRLPTDKIQKIHAILEE